MSLTYYFAVFTVSSVSRSVLLETVYKTPFFTGILLYSCMSATNLT